MYKVKVRWARVIAFIGVLVCVMCLCMGAGKAEESPQIEDTAVITVEQEQVVTEEKKDPVEDIEPFTDPNNYLPPYNTMSAEWGVDVYYSGFKYYSIPEGYKKAGGCLPEVVQVYLWEQCYERDLDYYIALALIEKESGYKYNASGDSGISKGYMQVQEKWHKKRMQAEGATDLYNPYDNIRVGLSFLDELFEKYDCWGFALMAYNMGESKAETYWNRGIFETDYTRYIEDRGQELRQELQQD
jgi:soluble lytic murein transglycosylase-like protein